MHLSARAEYAVRALVELAASGGQRLKRERRGCSDGGVIFDVPGMVLRELGMKQEEAAAVLGGSRMLSLFGMNALRRVLAREQAWVAASEAVAAEGPGTRLAVDRRLLPRACRTWTRASAVAWRLDLR